MSMNVHLTFIIVTLMRSVTTLPDRSPADADTRMATMAMAQSATLTVCTLHNS